MSKTTRRKESVLGRRPCGLAYVIVIDGMEEEAVMQDLVGVSMVRAHMELVG